MIRLMKLRSVTLGAIWLVSLCLPPAAEARLGESLAQCTERYGAPKGTLPSVIPDSDPEAVRFEQGQMSLLVHFQKGVAWHISYAQNHLSDPDKARLLNENATKGEWQPRYGELLGNVWLWNNREGGLVACGINRKNLNSLEVMTRPCAEAFGRARTQRLEAAAQEAASAGK